MLRHLQLMPLHSPHLKAHEVGVDGLYIARSLTYNQEMTANNPKKGPFDA